MLRSDVYQLAEKSYLADFDDLKRALLLKLREAQGAFAAKGIVGGPAFAEMVNIGAAHIQERCAKVSSELIHACESCGVGYYQGLEADIEDAYGRMTAGAFGDVVSDVIRYAAPHTSHLNEAQRRAECERMFLGPRISGQNRAVAKLQHFAAERKFKKRQWWKGGVRAVAAVIGTAILARITDIVQWFASLLSR